MVVGIVLGTGRSMGYTDDTQRMYVHAPCLAKSAKTDHMMYCLKILYNYRGCSGSEFLHSQYIHTHTHTHTHSVRRPEIVVLEAPTGSLLNQEITITCISVINATITVMVNESDGTSLSLTDVGITENSRSVNVTVTNTGRHNVTCVADNNGLTEMNTTQFYGISKLCSKYSYMYMKVWIVHVLALVCEPDS